MSDVATQLEILAPERHAQFMITHDREITQILDGLIERRALVSVYPEGEQDAFVTTLLAVEQRGGSVILDCAPTQHMNALALRAHELVCDTTLDKIKIQFILHPLTEIRWNEAPAYQAALPDAMLRLQRRNHFRLPVPMSHDVRCRFTMMLNPPAWLEGRVMDLSVGGLGMVLIGGVPGLSPGDSVAECRLSLPDNPVIKCRLKVRNRVSTASQRGTSQPRYGCEFVGLGAADATIIQRYILKVERDRIAREKAL